MNSYIESWDSPYHYKPFWEPEVTILVDVPEFDEGNYYTEHEIIKQEDYNCLIESIRTELFLAGWRSAITLPYTFHPDGGLVVIQDLYLDWDILFYCRFDVSRGYQSFPAESGFARPIPVHNDYSFSDISYDSDGSGFLYHCWLLWAEDFEIEDEG